MKIRLSRNLFIILGLDFLFIVFALYAAYWVRFEFSIPGRHFESFVDLLPYVLLIKLFFFYYFDLYIGMWRYTSLNDLFNVVKAATVSSVLLILFVLWRHRFEGFSRSVFLMDYFFTLFTIAGLRIGTRLAFERANRERDASSPLKGFFKILKKEAATAQRVLIIGAGNCGEKILREIHDNASIRYKVVGFLDDDPAKIGRKIHGIPVVDRIDRLNRAIESLAVSEVIIALPSVDASRIRAILEHCQSCNVKFKTVPGMGELINGRVTVKAIREVEFRDLLGRQPVHLDEAQIGAFLEGRTVFVSGAGGSIGRGLCRQICRFLPARIILFDWAESPLYEIELELKKYYENVAVVPQLGDIQSMSELERIFHAYRPEIVFHAAAYKHVPMLESHPWQAVENNITGTENLVDVADRYGCEKFVFVSTDKAVNPTSVMGASKRIAEMIVQDKSQSANSGSFITVRFGNVIGSVGSVVPLFKEQIKIGGPVTVTHPDIVRYFMLIPEACQLILQAGAMGAGGEIFILEMGEPVKIAELARELIRFSGFVPDEDIKITYTGLRPGEKLYEELISEREDIIETGHEKIMVLRGAEVNSALLNGRLLQLKKAAARRNDGAIRGCLREMLPEYQYICN